MRVNCMPNKQFKSGFVCIIGRPNVGKSSLVNKILGENRVIVSDIAGTTRDATDSEFENEFGKYVFIDTAGLRRKSKIKEDLERFSIIRTVAACLLYTSDAADD